MQLQAVALLAACSQSRSGHRFGSMNSAAAGTAWAPNSLTKRTIRGIERGEARQVAFVAVVPTEVEVAVGAVQQRQVWQHATVGDGRARLVGLLERSLDPAIEHRLVPRRQLLAGDVLECCLARVGADRSRFGATGPLCAHHTAIDG